jgi:hypothetical protein
MMRSPRSDLQGVRVVLLRGAAKLDGYNFDGPPFANPPSSSSERCIQGEGQPSHTS